MRASIAARGTAHQHVESHGLGQALTLVVVHCRSAVCLLVQAVCLILLSRHYLHLRLRRLARLASRDCRPQAVYAPFLDQAQACRGGHTLQHALPTRCIFRRRELAHLRLEARSCVRAKQLHPLVSRHVQPACNRLCGVEGYDERRVDVVNQELLHRGLVVAEGEFADGREGLEMR